MPKRKTMEENIADFNNVHGVGRYDYSKFCVKNTHEKGIIICHKIGKDGKEHGEFSMSAHNHKLGRGCKQCVKEKLSAEYTLSQEDFEIRATEVYGCKYDLSEAKYNGMHEIIKVICHVKDKNGIEHGAFYPTACNFLNGKGCRLCANEKLSSQYKLTQEEFEKRVNEVHGNEYDISQAIYNGINEKITVICHKKDKHGKEHGAWHPFASNFLKGQGCPHCNSSKLEKKTNETLQKHGINFERWKKFEWLKVKKHGCMSLDFYLSDYKAAIECQGEQHYNAGWKFTEEQVSLIQERDKLKLQLCTEHNVTIFYIRYNDNVEEKIKEIITKISKTV